MVGYEYVLETRGDLRREVIAPHAGRHLWGADYKSYKEDEKYGHNYFLRINSSFRSIQFSEKRLVPGCQSFGQSVHLLALFSHRIVLENREMSFRAHYGIEKFTGALRLWCIRTHGRDADAKEGKSRREGTSTYTNESLTFYPAGITLLNPPLKPQYSFIV